MKSYTVIKAFIDLQDANHRYEVGDTYPRKGSKPSDERITELATTANRRGEPMIEEKPKPMAEPVEEVAEEVAEETAEEEAEEAPKKRTRKRKEEASEE